LLRRRLDGAAGHQRRPPRPAHADGAAHPRQQLQSGERRGTAFLTTQLFFDDALDNSIVGSEPVYDTRGTRDTANSSDSVVPKSATTAANYIFDTAQMTDGAMLAWKTIILRTAAQASCSA
jgi:hypothetical protein